MQYTQRMIDFEAPPSAEVQHVAVLTSEPPPADQAAKKSPLVNPERQLTYGGVRSYEWPDPAYLHDLDTITVDRIHADIDGPSHRFVIQRGDRVEAHLAANQFDVGEVVGIRHRTGEVKVQFTEDSNGVWFYTGQIYPVAPTETSRPVWGSRHENIATEVNQDAQAKILTSVSRKPYSFAEFEEFYKVFRTGAASFAEYRDHFTRLVESEAAVKADLLRNSNAKGLAALAYRFGSVRARYCTKGENADSIVRLMLTRFLLNDSVRYSPLSGETYEGALRNKIESYTEGDYHHHFEQEQAHTLAYEKSLENPETLNEFSSFVAAKGDNALSTEQLARYDALRANSSRGFRASTQVKTVDQFAHAELATLTFTRKVGFHEKRDCPIHIVQLETRVERDAYNELNRKAKMLGGWYSSFKKADAGFQFLSEEQANQFCALLAGDVDRTNVLAGRKERRELSAAERLHELATDISTRADDTIERSSDSLQNTARRAGIQAGVRGQAYADQALARTIHSVAEALSTGAAKYLDGIRYRTQFETLESVLSQARWARLRGEQAEAKWSATADRSGPNNVDAKPIDETTLRWVEFPYPNLYRRSLLEAIDRGRKTRGVMQSAEALRKYLGVETAGDAEFSRQYGLDALFDFLERAKSHGIDVERQCAATENYKRLVRANIMTLPELRAALREYLPHRAERRGDDPVKVAERELIGLNLPSFFPTPRPVIERMLVWADVEPSHRVLEPSCGKGDIVDALKEAYPNLQLVAIEHNHVLADILSAKGHTVEFGDFLQHAGEYDRIVMNPPFEGGQDMTHIQHAYSLLAPRGRLVSVISEGAFGRHYQRNVEFGEWLDQIGADIEHLPEEAFGGRDAFRQTGVRTRLVIINKGGHA